MPRYTHDADDRVYACPNCDLAGDVYKRTHKDREYDKPFRCHKCGHEFDEPAVRPPKSQEGDRDHSDEDGLPRNLNPETKQLVKKLRGS